MYYVRNADAAVVRTPGKACADQRVYAGAKVIMRPPFEHHKFIGAHSWSSEVTAGAGRRQLDRWSVEYCGYDSRHTDQFSRA